MSKLIFQHPPSVAELKVHLRKMKMTVTAEQEVFLREHEGHNSLSIESDRIYCRTCNRRDGQ